MAADTLEEIVARLVETVRGRFYGKFRGIVTDVDDPLGIGRIRAMVPEVLDDQESPWALPCAPFAGAGHGFVGLPEVDDGCWIEFEAGDPSRPVWTGGWWGTADAVAELQDATTRALVTSAGHKILIDESADTIAIEHSSGSTVEVKNGEISLQAGSGKVVLSAAGININNGALTVRG